MIKETIPLNKGQTEALTKMVEWVKMKGFESTFGLYGKAGTGKTTVTKEFINQCGIPKHKIAVSAPTHKAKRVIERITNLQGHTLQSLLGLRLDLDLADYDPDDPKFTPQAEPTISDYKVVILDECSMVNADLEETLVKQSKIFGVKLLYLGDPNQLPPIGEKISKTFTNPTYNYTLTEVMRQNFNNPLTQLLNTLVDDIENGTNNYIKSFYTEIENFNDEGEGYVITKNIQYFGEMVKNKFTSNEFMQSIEHCKYLAWTNQSVRQWNNYVRKVMFNNPTEDIVVGEVVFSYKTLMADANLIIVSNSEEYIVQSFESVFSSPNNTDCYKVKLMDIDFNPIQPLTFVKRKSIENFKEVLIRKQEYAKANRAWRAYYKWKDSFLLTLDIADPENPKKRLAPKDFDYGYGVTVHKSQGSTYDAVFVNAADILRNYDEVERKKLLYVALSRAKNQAAILI